MKMNAVQYTNNVLLKIKLEQDNLLRLHVSEYITKLKQNDVIILNYFDVDKNDYQTIVCKIERLVYEKGLFGKRPVVYCYVCDVKDEANKKTKDETHIVGVEYDDAVIIGVHNNNDKIEVEDYFVSREIISKSNYRDEIELNLMLDNNSILKISFDKEKRIFVQR